MSGGPFTWPDFGGTPAFAGGLYFDRTHLDNALGVPIDFSGRGGFGTQIPMADGTTVEQSHYLGGDLPVNLRPESFSFEMTVQEEVDYHAVLEAKSIGRPIDLWFDWIWHDVWWVPGMNGGQTTWRFSRKLPFGLVPGISQASRPPAAFFLDSADVKTNLTIVTSAPASGTELQIPDSSGYQNATTHSSIIATSFVYLVVRYSAMFMVRVTSIDQDLEAHNAINFAIDLQEHLGGLYTHAVGT